MPSLDIKDYVNLHVKNSHKLDTGVYEWTVPHGYYSNKRSSVCTVHVVAASVRTEAAHDGGLFISYETGAFNTVSAATAHHHDSPILSHLSPHGRSNPSVFDTEVPQCKLQVAARPEKIKLNFADTRDHLVKAVQGGMVTLCFEYYDSADTAEQFHEQFVRTL